MWPHLTDDNIQHALRGSTTADRFPASGVLVARFKPSIDLSKTSREAVCRGATAESMLDVVVCQMRPHLWGQSALRGSTTADRFPASLAQIYRGLETCYQHTNAAMDLEYRFRPDRPNFQLWPAEFPSCSIGLRIEPQITVGLAVEEARRRARGTIIDEEIPMANVGERILGSSLIVSALQVDDHL
jgi:hypothetical protein